MVGTLFCLPGLAEDLADDVMDVDGKVRVLPVCV
jgi:hypothetical protein